MIAECTDQISKENHIVTALRIKEAGALTIMHPY